MQTAKVIGTARATAKHESFVGQKLLVIQPLMADGGPDGPPLLCLDEFGAGKGNTVLITSDGSHTKDIVGEDANTPARWATMGIVD